MRICEPDGACTTFLYPTHPITFGSVSSHVSITVPALRSILVEQCSHSARRACSRVLRSVTVAQIEPIDDCVSDRGALQYLLGSGGRRCRPNREPLAAWRSGSPSLYPLSCRDWTTVNVAEYHFCANRVRTTGMALGSFTARTVRRRSQATSAMWATRYLAASRLRLRAKSASFLRTRYRRRAATSTTFRVAFANSRRRTRSSTSPSKRRR